nr:MAG TPA: hypothetical protein [Caudoviricetes sp.]
MPIISANSVTLYIFCILITYYHLYIFLYTKSLSALLPSFL